MTEFLSEENIAMHKEYIRQKHLKYSIIESYLPTIRGLGVRDILSLRLDKRDRGDILALLPEIVLHNIYFSSFAEKRNSRSDILVDMYGSEAAYLNRLYRLAESATQGFLVIEDARNASVITDYKQAFFRTEPILSVDLCEHAYFPDYGFDRDMYIISCLSYLDLSKIQK